MSAIVPTIALIALILTFLDYSKESRPPTTVENSEWLYYCGDPSVYERIVFYEDRVCWYFSKDANGNFSSAEGSYIVDPENGLIGIRFFRGARTYMMNYKILEIASTGQYYIGEIWDEHDTRYFIKQDQEFVKPPAKPTFEKSQWIYSCGNPEYYEQIEVFSLDSVMHTINHPVSGYKEAYGKGTLIEEGHKLLVAYQSENRNFSVTYSIYQEPKLGRYYILEKWSETDSRFFIHSN